MSTNLLIEIMVRDVEKDLRAARLRGRPTPGRPARNPDRRTASRPPPICPDEPRALRPSL